LKIVYNIDTKKGALFMKKFQFIAICVLCVLILVVSIKMFNISTVHIPETRISCGIITNIDSNDNSLVIEDLTGNEWVFDDMPNWQLGDVVIIKFNTNHTIMIEDDEIISIEYCGHYDNFNIK